MWFVMHSIASFYLLTPSDMVFCAQCLKAYQCLLQHMFIMPQCFGFVTPSKVASEHLENSAWKSFLVGAMGRFPNFAVHFIKSEMNCIK
jgi:hypothetical protein